jgi:tetratricopeptide (TPR) repeat protein
VNPTPSADRRPWRDDRFWVVVALLVAAVIRLFLLLQLADSPFGEYLGLDERYYHTRAQEIAAGEGPELPFFMSPLYQLLLGGVYALLGGSWWTVRVLQALLGLGTLLLVWLTARRLAGRWWALGILGAAVLYSQLFFTETLLLPTTLTTFLLVLGAYLLMRYRQKPSWKTALGIGLVFALAALGHGLLAVPAAAAGLYVFFKRLRNYKRKAFGELGVLVAAAVVVLAPVAVANSVADGDFVPLTTNGGLNLYIGNQPGAVGLYRPYDPATYSLDFTARRPAEREAAERGKPPPTASEVSAYWARKFWQECERDPWRVLGLFGKRALLLLNGYEYPQVENFYFEGEFVPLLKWPWLSLYLLLPLGAAGLVLSRRRGTRVLGVAALAYAVALLPFFVTARFRLPVVPLVIIGAGLFVERVIRLIRLQNRRKCNKKFRSSAVLTAAILIPLIAAAAYRPEVTRAYDNHAVGYNNLGTEAYARGDYAGAVRYQELALEQSPSMLPARLNLGQSLLAAGEYARAEEELTGLRGSRLDPARLELLIAQAQRGRGDDLTALATLQRASEAPFAEGTLLAALSTLYLELGDAYHARETGRRAVELSPDRPDGYLALARAEFSTGDESEAMAHVRAGLDRSVLKAELLLFAGGIGGDVETFEEAASAAATEGNWTAWARAFASLSRLGVRAGSEP